MTSWTAYWEWYITFGTDVPEANVAFSVPQHLLSFCWVSSLLFLDLYLALSPCILISNSFLDYFLPSVFFNSCFFSFFTFAVDLLMRYRGIILSRSCYSSRSRWCPSSGALLLSSGLTGCFPLLFVWLSLSPVNNRST